MRIRSALAVLAIAACSGKPGGPVPVPKLGSGSGSAVDPGPGSAGSGSAVSAKPGGPSVKVTLAEVGLEAGSLDRTSDPCVDFYQFACGGWLTGTVIPPERVRASRATEIEDRNRTAVRAILEEAARGINVDLATRKLGDFYAACMDEAQLEKVGIAALKAMLAKVEVKNAAGWQGAVAELHRAGVWVVWSVRVEPDAKEAGTNITQLDTGWFGLPDHHHYTRPDKKAVLDGYRLHVAKLLNLANPALSPDKADLAAGDVLAIEAELAALARTPAERRELAAHDNRTDAAGLAKQVKTVDWKAYWKALGATPSKRINVATPRHAAAIDRLRAKFTPAQWTSYFSFHLIAHGALALPKAFDDEAFELRKVLAGVEKQYDRGRRCTDLAQGVLADSIGPAFAAKHAPPASRTKATEAVDAIARALGERVGRAPWLGEAGQKAAQAKLGKLTRQIAAPEKWRTLDLEVRRDDAFGNLVRAGAANVKRSLDRAGKPVERGEWQTQVFAASASYDFLGNALAVPAGLMQPPFFGPDRSVPANLGGLALAAASELARGFGERGALYDADGNHKDTWSKDERAKFDTTAACLVDQYDAFEALPKQFVSGKQTFSENVADLAGVKSAYDAYRALRKDAPKVYIADGFSEDQQFFIAVAQAQCTRERPAEQQLRLLADPHSPPKFRVYGVLRNMREFTQAFSCAPGTPMHPAKVCSIW